MAGNKTSGWIKDFARIPSEQHKKPEKIPEKPKPRRKKSIITAEDHALWVHVAKSAKPLAGRRPPEMPDLPAGQEPVITAPARSLPIPAQPEPKVRTLPPLAGIEKRLMKDVARGHRAIDARIDLHGMRQAEAHAALNGFIYRAHASGAKLVLVITGKGAATGDGFDMAGEGRGVLKRLVPHWLADPVMRRVVIGFENAARGHGGEGALYVRIRRNREHI